MNQEITDQEISRQRAEVAAGISLAEAQRNARANNVAASAFDGEALRTGEHACYAPHTWLETQLNEALGRWDSVKQTMFAGQPAQHFAKPRALAAIRLLDSALSRLGTRTGPREDAARQALTAQRDCIASALAHFESLGALLDGPLARELCDRITTSRAALAAAYAAKERASRQTIEAALLEIEKCLADSRALDRDLEAARTALNPPEFPSVADFEQARFATEALERQASKNPTARAMYDALHAAFNANPAVAKLFVIYETQPEHVLVKLRAKATAESAGS